MRRSRGLAVLLALAGALSLLPQPSVQAASATPGWTTGAWQTWRDAGQAASTPAVAADPPSQALYVLMRGTDQNTWLRTFGQGAWSNWSPLGHSSVSGPAAAFAGGTLYIAQRGLDNHLWFASRTGGALSAWTNLGGLLTSRPAVAASGTDEVDVFVRGTDRALWQISRRSGSWGAWRSLGGVLASAPAAVSSGAGVLDVFAMGTDGHLWHRGYEGGWGAWQSLGGGVTAEPAASSDGSRDVSVFVRGTDHAIWRRSRVGGAWSAWSPLGGVATSGPTAAADGAGGYDVLVRGTDAGAWHLSSAGGPWQRLGLVPGYNVIPDVRYQAQVHALSCEAAVLAMALTHQALSAGQDRILGLIGVDGRAGYYDGSGVIRWGDPYRNFVGSPDGSELDLTGYGVYYPPIARVAAALGMTVEVARQGLGPTDVYRSLLEGHVVMTWIAYDWRFHGRQPWKAFDGRWIPYAGPLEHAVLLVGVSGGGVKVFDPARGTMWVSRSSFESTYATYSDMAVVFQ